MTLERPVSPKDRMLFLEIALSHVKSRRTAVDVGAHIGRFTKVLAGRFDSVIAIEPMPVNQVGWRKRLEGIPNARLIEAAAADYSGMCRMDGPEHWKFHYAVPDESGDVETVTIDSLNIKHLDFLKVDCEGGDTLVLRGAEKTLRRCHPVVMVESIARLEARYGLPEGAPITFLEGLGYQLVDKFHVDHILTLEEV